MTDSQKKKAIKKLEAYARKRGWKVKYVNVTAKNKDMALTGVGEIRITKRRSLDYTMFVLCHEIGHMMTINTQLKNPMYDLFKANKYGTLSYRVLQVEEEVQAWEKGYKLLKELAISFEELKFAKVKASCLTTWMEYVLQVKKNRESQKIYKSMQGKNSIPMLTVIVEEEEKHCHHDI
jgi:hypothetical protein